MPGSRRPCTERCVIRVSLISRLLVVEYYAKVISRSVGCTTTAWQSLMWPTISHNGQFDRRCGQQTQHSVDQPRYASYYLFPMFYFSFISCCASHLSYLWAVIQVNSALHPSESLNRVPASTAVKAGGRYYTYTRSDPIRHVISDYN